LPKSGFSGALLIQQARQNVPILQLVGERPMPLPAQNPPWSLGYSSWSDFYFDCRSNIVRLDFHNMARLYWFGYLCFDDGELYFMPIAHF
jgi:hypothetical protein